MFCRNCGAANPEGSRFCGDCGTTMSVAAGETAPPGAFAGGAAPPGAFAGGAAPPGAFAGGAAPPGAASSSALVRPVMRTMQAPAWRPCPRCGAQAVVPFFYRPMNIFKLFVATWFWFAPAVLYFFIRKDRQVCRGCGAVRGEQGDLAAVESIQVERLEVGSGGALTVAPRDPEAEVALVQARGKERGAIVLASVAVGFAALSLFSAGLAVPALVAGAAALIPFFRSRSLRRMGEARRRRHETLRVLELAAVRGGSLSVTDVAATLQMEMTEAEQALDRMVDGRRVDVEVDDEGRVMYVFRELARRNLEAS